MPSFEKASLNLEVYEKQGKIKGLDIGYITGYCQGYKPFMEDFHVCLPNFDAARSIGLFAVFDGNGNSGVARYTARRLPEALLASAAYKNKQYERALRDVFKHIDTKLWSSSAQKEIASYCHEGDVSPMTQGTTACVCLFLYGAKPARLVVANVGDSRAFITKVHKGVKLLTVDHKPNVTAEKARISVAGGFSTDFQGDGSYRVHSNTAMGTLGMSRALGQLQFKTDSGISWKRQIISGEPDVRVRNLTEDDEFLVIGSDGVFDSQSIHWISLLIDSYKRTSKMNGIARDLVTQCLDSGDNITVIILALKPNLISMQGPSNKREAWSHMEVYHFNSGDYPKT